MNAYCQEWESELRRLLIGVPVDGDDDAARIAGERVRDHVAKQWQKLEGESRETFRKRVKELTQLEGTEVAWCPLPQPAAEIAPVQAADPDEQDEVAADSGDCVRKIPHSFRWVRTAEGVWTILLATLLHDFT